MKMKNQNLNKKIIQTIKKMTLIKANIWSLDKKIPDKFKNSPVKIPQTNKKESNIKMN